MYNEEYSVALLNGYLSLFHQHLRDKFWNFVFYKFIFLFGVMDVQDLGDILGWCMWFAALGFFLLISELAKDRFEYVSQATRGGHR